jgi:subtilisin family serine protease
MKKFLIFPLLFLFSMVTFSQTTNLSKNVDKRVIISLKDNSLSKALDLIEQKNAKLVINYDQLNMLLIEIPQGKTQDEFMREIKDVAFLKAVYKDEYMEYKRDIIPNDIIFGSQWHLRSLTDKDIDADQAWDSIPSNNIPTSVAVFDGGVDITHEDLVGNLVQPFNAVTNLPSNGELVDPLNDRHGTACSGTIAAVSNNSRGVASVGYNKVKVMSVNIMTSISSGGSFGTTTSIQINAVNAAIAQGCVAISMSYGGSSYAQALNDAFIIAKNQARNGRGLFICASTGNNSSGTITQYPASYSAVYGIGATTSTDLRASFSNFGNIVDISAPGAGIFTTDLTGSSGYNGGDYASVSGTSFSCPITAAAGALIAYKNPNLTEADIMNILAATAEKVGGYAYAFNGSYPLSSRSAELGYGRINLFEAIKLTPLVGNPVINPPAQQHNFVIFNCSVNSTAPNLGSTITITTTQKTTAQQFTQVSPKVQYRFSADALWSADDLIIGTDTSTLGGGIESEIETINFTIPSNLPSGTRYILIRGNFDNAITETTSIDNSCSLAISLLNPGSNGLDLMSLWNVSQFSTCNSSLGGQVSCRFRNTGVVPITTFSYRWRWQDCAVTNGCVVTTMGSSIVTSILGSPLQPNQTSISFTTGFSIASIPVNGSRVLLCEITSVNGLPNDDFSGNNIAAITIFRLSCTSSTNSTDSENEDEYIVKVETPRVQIFTIGGFPLEETNVNNLPHGIYVVKYIYSDRVVTEKIGK